jgi:hypothetical protein
MAVSGGMPAGKWRDENPEELELIRESVARWRDEHPDGSEEEMVTELGKLVRADYEPVLRAVWFSAGLPPAGIAAGITIITGTAGE